MTRPERDGSQPEHPWRTIDLDLYERHMNDAQVGQLQQLHDITREQLAAAYPCRAVGLLGIAGGNGLDLVDPATTDAVFGYDINADYLLACESRHRDRLGARLHLVEATIDRCLRIEPVDLLVANLIIEYVGVEEFAAFIATNSPRMGHLSCVIQRNDTASFVSSTAYAESFDALASVASDVDAETLEAAMTGAGFIAVRPSVHPLPNGKTLVRQDFQPDTAAHL